MAISRSQLLILTLGLLVKVSHQYSFRNCKGAKNSQNQTFLCYKPHKMNISTIVDDLPVSAINITISSNHLSHIPKGSFQRFLKLENLNMDHNVLRSMDGLAFQKLHCLKSLNLSSNLIPKLNSSVFHELDNLISLSLESNSLTDLPESLFLSTPLLDTLILRKNHLNNFSNIAQSISALNNLTQLDLCFNKLTSLSNLNIALPESLTQVFVCGNKLSALDCTGSFLMHITFLDLSYNFELSTNAFEGVDLTRIRYLRLRSTKVKILEFLNKTNVNAKYVDFSGLGLTNTSLINDLCKFLSERVVSISRLTLVNNSISESLNDALSNCPQILTTLDVSSNNLRTVQCLDFLKGQKHIKTLNVEHNHIGRLLPCNNTNKLPITKLNFRYNRMLMVEKYAFAHTPNVTTLNLNINIIAVLENDAFRGLTRLQTLRLDNNILTDLYEDTFQDLSSLRILNLRNNRIAVIFKKTFRQLVQLTTLDLGLNKITHFEEGGLDGLKSLKKFFLDGNNLKEIESGQFTGFQKTLQVLDLRNNKIVFPHETTSSPFVNLSTLTSLNLDGQRPNGISFLPNGLFRGLHSLRLLYLSNNRIAYLNSDVFDHLTALQFLTLDNSGNGVVQLRPGLFKNLRNLTTLSVVNMGIPNLLEDVFGNLTQLQILQINKNAMKSIDVDVLGGLHSLLYLDMTYIPLSCSCRNQKLQKWTLNQNNVQIIQLGRQPCQDKHNKKFIDFETDVCNIDVEKYLYLTTATVLLVFSVVPILYVKLYWKIKYGYYVFRAWFSEQWRKLREDEENCEYDAFISYNFHDEHWVLEQLLPNLEGNGSSFKLCLHHRDFEPGRNIMDNIVSAVYGSGKTVCVVSRNFLQSEWCSMEIQLASYRLFDEHRDVLLLVFLEHIPKSELSTYHRMRKVMSTKTFLQWPGSECTDPTHAQLLFWKQLRRALRTGCRVEDEEEAGENKSSETEERHRTASSVNYTADEIYYLP